MKAKLIGTMRAGIAKFKATLKNCGRHWKCRWLPVGLVCLCTLASAQAGINLADLNESGHIVIAGHSTPYLIRHLPPSSFPQLPAEIQTELNQRGCLIPQTYEAYGPENVIHGSFERAGSSDWAVLCSVHGTASLLVFFGSKPTHPYTLASEPETERLQANIATGVWGFNWGINSASPEDVQESQTRIFPPPPPLTHDAIADSVVEHSTIYHYYSNGAWTLVQTSN